MPRNAKLGGGEGFGLKYSQKPATDTVDDNFRDATNESGPVNGLASKWTVTRGQNVAVPLPYPGTAGYNYYDLTSSGKARFLSGGGSGSGVNDRIHWYQNWTLGVDESLVASFSIGTLTNNNTAYPGRRSDSMRAGISLTDNAAGPRLGNFITCGWQGYATSARLLISSDTNTVADSAVNRRFTQSSHAIFRIWRSDNDDGYVAFAATDDSDTWHQVSQLQYPSSATMNHLWVEVWPQTNTVGAAQHITLNWIRKGSGNYDPWSY